MPLIELRKATVWLEGRAVLHELDWRLERGAHFAVLGGNGAGKSTLMRLLAGQIWPRPHFSRGYDFGTGPTWSPLRAREKVALLSPEIQERFVRQSQAGADGERGWNLDARTAILAAFFGSELLHQRPDAEQERRADELISRLKLEDLASRALTTLSQGQLRRVLLARALISRPQVLLLDEACSGLDAASREEMLELLDGIARGGETTLGLTTHRHSEIVPSIQQVLTLENGRFIEAPRLALNRRLAEEQEASRLSDEFEDETLLELRNASVFLDGAPILHDLNWKLRRGEHFAIEGGNGAGKTTFLRLLRGELWPARGGVIERFGNPKPMSRAAVGRQISLLSPALQARYNAEIPVETAVASGWFDALGEAGPLSAHQARKTREIIEKCGLSELSNRSLNRLSYGQRRRVLLARALVTEPQILLLDEALDGLDSASRAVWNGILAEVASRGTSLVVTSHHKADYPPFLTHVTRLDAGRISAQRELV
ncbi:MAG TPA: ATP-binding cassette domain-containing protein [Abditibacterium sp.]|jgi:molybdate transport system ATP-binding protein